ncbi:MAG: HAD hydrolase-like protein [Treponema sp.]|nr:HAD hydrolase-like protein [Treponema sp.]
MFEKRKFDALILDIDGTIWNTTGIVAVAWNKAIEISGFDASKVNAQILQNEFGKTMDVIAKDLWPSLEKSKRDILLSHCCSEEQIALKENNLEICYAGVVDTVKEISVHENVYVVSNCQNGYIELMLDKTGLKCYIKDFECFGRTGKGKAENIQLLMTRNQIHYPVYVGDTQGDADACAQAGVKFVWASYGFGKVSQYYDKISNFEEIKKLFDSYD